MPDYSREELVTELKRRRATKPLEMQPSHVPYSWETPEASLRRIEGIPEGYGETEPWIDPTSVFAAGAGTGLRAGLQAGKPLVSAAMQGLRSGLAGAAMDYPVGTVAGAVGEKYPAAAFPLSVGLGIASGKYIEPKLEAGLRKLPEYAEEVAPYAKMKLAEQRGSFSTKPLEKESPLIKVEKNIKSLQSKIDEINKHRQELSDKFGTTQGYGIEELEKLERTLQSNTHLKAMYDKYGVPEQPEFTREDLVAELKRRRQTK